MTTFGTRAVVSKGKVENVLKKAKWGNPKILLQDHAVVDSVIPNEKASTRKGTASEKGQREEKAPMIEEDIQATHKTKEQLRQEEAGLEEAIKLQAQLDEEATHKTKEQLRQNEAGLEEAIKLQAQLDEEVTKKIHLDKMIAKRMAEEEALTEQQKKRKAQV
ncbi:hypothetical protein Tco_1579737 [Tanacetum coccineum]